MHGLSHKQEESIVMRRADPHWWSDLSPSTSTPLFVEAGMLAVYLRPPINHASRHGRSATWCRLVFSFCFVALLQYYSAAGKHSIDVLWHPTSLGFK